MLGFLSGCVLGFLEGRRSSLGLVELGLLSAGTLSEGVNPFCSGLRTSGLSITGLWIVEGFPLAGRSRPVDPGTFDVGRSDTGVVGLSVDKGFRLS